MALRATAAAALLCLQTGVAAAAGVQVVDVTPGHAFAEAGLEPGDRLLGYAVALDAGDTREGRFDSVFDVFRASTESAPRGRPTLEVMRDGATRSLPVPDGAWAGELAPGNALIDRFLAARAQLADDGTVSAGRIAMAALVEEADDPLAAAWYRHTLAEALRRIGETALGDAQTELAVDAVLAQRNAYAAGWLLQKAAIEYAGRGEPARSQVLFDRAIATWEADDPQSLAYAHGLNNAAILASIRGDHANATQLAGRALGIRRAMTGDSLITAESLHTLGNAALWSDRLDEAEARYREALEIRRVRAPGSMNVARNLAVLANIYWRHGQLAEAQSLTEDALAIYRERGTDPVYIGESLVMLGHFAHDRGDYAAAETYRLQALDIFESSNPQATQVPDTLLGLGNVAWRRGDVVAAEGYFDRALARYEILQPGGQRVALVTLQLGLLALERGEVDAAAERIAGSLAVVEALGGDGPLLAARYQALAKVAIARDNHDEAASLLAQALALYTRRTARNLQAAGVHRDLAAVARAEDRGADARGSLQTALDIAAELAPGTLHEALPAYDLARLLEAGGERERALEHYERAVDALERQRTLLGGSDRARTGFEERYGHFYKDYLRLLLELGREAQAFDVLERYRARAMLALMAERRLDPAGPRNAELTTRLERANWRYEQARLALAESGEPTAADAAGLRRLRSEREELVERLREQDPALAAEIAPRPLELAQALAAVPADTALLSYAVLDDSLALFVLPAGGNRDAAALRVYRLPLAREMLQADLRRLRRLLQAPGAGDVSRKALAALSARLHALLIEPAADAIGDAGRLLIVPDGPLHLLPFGLLANGDDGRYLVERWPYRIALSVTVFDLLRPPPAGNAGNAPVTIAAIGAPLAASVAAGPAARESGFALPAAREELAVIGDMFADAVVHAGAAASEARVRAIDPQTHILHFATHAVADHRHPLDSHLVLSPAAGGPDDGLLHAWEIYEQLAFAADLVVLSACETGLGTSVGGDGLVSLTRAFQHAGARAVLASLWPVSDPATAALMRRFYAELRGGASNEDALRTAQIALAKGSGWQRLRGLFSGDAADYRHPYYWAGFQLHGRGQ